MSKMDRTPTICPTECLKKTRTLAYARAHAENKSVTKYSVGLERDSTMHISRVDGRSYSQHYSRVPALLLVALGVLEVSDVLTVFSAALLVVLAAGVPLDIVELSCKLVIDSANEEVVDDDDDDDELEETTDELPVWSVLLTVVSFSELVNCLSALVNAAYEKTTYVYSAQSKRSREALVPCSAVITRVCLSLLNPVLL